MLVFGTHASARTLVCQSGGEQPGGGGKADPSELLHPLQVREMISHLGLLESDSMALISTT